VELEEGRGIILFIPTSLQINIVRGCIFRISLDRPPQAPGVEEGEGGAEAMVIGITVDR
jgi:hypothetical protein